MIDFQFQPRQRKLKGVALKFRAEANPSVWMDREMVDWGISEFGRPGLMALLSMMDRARCQVKDFRRLYSAAQSTPNPHCLQGQ